MASNIGTIQLLAESRSLPTLAYQQRVYQAPFRTRPPRNSAPTESRQQTKRYNKCKHQDHCKSNISSSSSLHRNSDCTGNRRLTRTNFLHSSASGNQSQVEIGAILVDEVTQWKRRILARFSRATTRHQHGLACVLIGLITRYNGRLKGSRRTCRTENAKQQNPEHQTRKQ